METAIAEVPAHVPEHLVHAWKPMEAPGADFDPHTANIYLLDGPDIFYNPVPWGATGTGSWVVVRYELAREVFQNPELFSNKKIAGFSKLLGEDWDLLPLERDPPEHSAYRLIVNPLFSPKRITELEGAIRDNAVTLIEGLKKRDKFDFVPEFGQRFPISVVMGLIGLDLDDLPTWVDWGQGLLHGETIQDRINAAAAIKDYLMKEIRDRRETPRDDVMSKVVNAEINGRRLTEEEALGMMYLLFVGGLDTVASVLGFTFRHLAVNPQLQDRLRREPGKVVDALEEIIRAHGIVNNPRYLTQDLEFHGVKMKAGDRIILAQSVFCRDPQFYDQPNEIDIDRTDRQHMVFAAGPHRCMGSHLARKEMAIALEEWVTRAPKFALDPDDKPQAQAGGVWGMQKLPLMWTR